VSNLTNKECVAEEWCMGYVLDFTDGESEGQVLHRGTLESCEDMRRLLPAVTYSGEREIKGASTFVMRAIDWETL
jgi:hypothetical protein